MTIIRGFVNFFEIFLLPFEVVQVLLRLQLRYLLDLAFQSHIGFLKVLDVLMLHLVHVDRFQNLQILSQYMISMTIVGSCLLVPAKVLVLWDKDVAAAVHFGLRSVRMRSLALGHGHFPLESDRLFWMNALITHRLSLGCSVVLTIGEFGRVTVLGMSRMKLIRIETLWLAV